MSARVRHEEIGALVGAVVGGRDPHARVRVRHAFSSCALPELKVEPGLARLPRPAVHVEPVRVEVVGDVEIEASVTVDVREQGSQPMVERSALEPGLASDLTERRAAVVARPLVEVEAVVDGQVIGREPFVGAGRFAFGSV